MVSEATGGPVFLSTLTAERHDKLLGGAVAAVSLLLFAVLVPFATLPLPKVWAFIPIYESALVVNDLITAVLLFGQFGILRSRALVVLACGYLFTAFLAIGHAATFPGLFSPSGLLGAGQQSTVWLYMLWHGGFPLFVMAYALLEEQEAGGPVKGSTFLTVLYGMGMAGGLAAACVVLVTAGHDLLPVLLAGGRYTLAMNGVVGTVWGLSLLTLIMLWRRHPHSVLDLWVMVVLWAWVCDIGLSAVFNAARFDLGFYAGRLFGLLASSFVLMMLVSENAILYGRLVKASYELHRLCVIDPLTGVSNRRAFEDAMDREWRRAMRNKSPLSLLMIDVDFFKRYNDRYGHVAGDHCLRSVAEVLSLAVKRAGDTVTRYGGEEFVILLPNIEAEEAHRIAQRLCQGVSELNIPHRDSEAADHVTISVGVASLRHANALDIDQAVAAEQWMKAAGHNPTLFVEAADQALYAAKSSGRDQVVDRLFEVAPITHYDAA